MGRASGVPGTPQRSMKGIPAFLTGRDALKVALSASLSLPQIFKEKEVGKFGDVEIIDENGFGLNSVEKAE